MARKVNGKGGRTVAPKGDGGKASRAARDLGMAQTLAANHLWKMKAINLIRENLYAWRGTGEELHDWLRRKGLHEPGHHNSWSSLDGFLKIYGYIIDTGEIDHMKKESSHGRKTSVYVSAAR